MSACEQSNTTPILNEDQDSGSSPPISLESYKMASHSRWLLVSKRMIDIVISMLFLVGFSWIYIILALGVALSSGVPVIYSQKRYGQGGRQFNFYKFRSMMLNASEVFEAHLAENPAARSQWDNFQKLDCDPRVTSFGNFLRKTSLDELPQFWNVLKGDMSLVGPRPCMVSQRGLYGSGWGYYCSVRPGITGLWQVSGRNGLSFKKRVALDAQYVKSLSVRTDAFIFVKTIAVVITGNGSA